MTFLGPWLTRPTFERGTISRSSSSTSVRRGFAASDGWVKMEETQGHMSGLAGAALDAPIISGASNERTTVDVRSTSYTTGIDPTDPVGNALHPAGKYSAEARVGHAYVKPSSYAPPAIPQSEWPEGATGYEWESDVSTVVGVRASWSLAGITALGSVPFQSVFRLGYEPWDGSPPVALLPAASELARFIVSAGSIPLVTGAATLSGFDAQGGVVFTADPVSFGFNTNDTHASDSAKGGVQVFLFGGTVSGMSSIGMTYTMQPPRLRWIYAEEPPPVVTGTPPLQQYPREDGLRSSSARQHYPRPRSQQASNQHYGGYF